MSKKLVALLLAAIVLVTIVPISIEADSPNETNDDSELLVLSSSYVGSIEYNTGNDFLHIERTSNCIKLFLADNGKVDAFNHLIEEVKNGSKTVKDLLDFEDDFPADYAGWELMKNKNVVQYGASSRSDGVIFTCSQVNMQLEKIYFEPTVYTYLVEAGGTLTIKATDIQGGNLFWKNHSDNNRHLITEGKTMKIDVVKTSWIDIVCDNERGSLDNILVSASVSISGNSAPHDTPIVLIVICILVAIAVAGIMVYTGMKPKWSK